MFGVTREWGGWDFSFFQLGPLFVDPSWTFETADDEMAIVVLGGRIGVESDRGQWSRVGERDSVFSGLPYALYLPRHTRLTVNAETDCEFAVALAPTDQDHQPRLLTPRDIEIDIRGVYNVTPQLNTITPPGFPCHRLAVVEVYTPPVHWPTYPPPHTTFHKTIPTPPS